jgi:hypothetical protein
MTSPEGFASSLLLNVLTRQHLWLLVRIGEVGLTLMEVDRRLEQRSWAMVILWVTALGLGCAFTAPDCTSGFVRDEAGKCLPISANSGDSDTGGPVGPAGEFTGAISIEVLAETGGLEIADSCDGPIAFDLKVGMIEGIVECRFQGSVDGLVGGQTFVGTIDGLVDDEGLADGQMVLDLDIFGVLDEAWSGTASTERVEGSMSGEMSIEVGALVVPVDFSGTFEAKP